MKIHVNTPVQHDGVDYAEGENDVSDKVGHALLKAGLASKPGKEGKLDKADGSTAGGSDPQQG